MTRSEFIKAISENTDINRDIVDAVINSGEKIIMDRMKNLEPVRPFKGITLNPKIKKGGVFLNPRTLDKMITKDKIVVKTVFSKVFNETLNGSSK